MDTKATVREFVSANFYIPEQESFADDTSLLEDGIVDSTGILEVVTFLEDTFGIRVEDSELVPENLDTIDGIAAFVARKRKLAS